MPDITQPIYTQWDNWILPLVWGWFAFAVLTAPKREAWAWIGVALVIRLILVEPTWLMGSEYPFVRLQESWVPASASGRYGPTWAAFMGTIWWFVGGAEHVLTVNLALSALTVGWVFTALNQTPHVARAAAAILCVSPLAVYLSRTESMFVLAAALQAAAVAGVSRESHRGDVFSGLSLLLLVFLRPYQWFAAAAITAFAAARGHTRLAAVVGLVLVGRAVQLGFDVVSNGAGSRAGLRMVGADWGSLQAYFQQVAVFDPHRTPLGLTALTLAGVGLSRSRPRHRWWLAIGLAGALPYMIFWRPTDILRFQAPPATWWAVLAGIGAAWLWEHYRRWVPLLTGLVAVSFLPAWPPIEGEPIWQIERRFLEQSMRHVPPGSTIWYSNNLDKNYRFGRYAYTKWGVRFTPIGTGPASTGDWHYRGRAGRPDAGSPYEDADTNCTPDPIQSMIVQAPWGAGVEFFEGPVLLELSKLSQCIR